MPRSDAERKARAEYEKRSRASGRNRRLVVNLYESDADIKARIEKIESMGLGYQEYIRELIRHDITKRPI